MAPSIRHARLPLAVVEAMTLGMPVVALATTELPTVIEGGMIRYLSRELGLPPASHTDNYDQQGKSSA